MLINYRYTTVICWNPSFFFFNDTATTEIYTLSLHDALPILKEQSRGPPQRRDAAGDSGCKFERSEEHTSELQSRLHLVCRLLLEKKKMTTQQLLKGLNIDVSNRASLIVRRVGCIRDGEDFRY